MKKKAKQKRSNDSILDEIQHQIDMEEYSQVYREAKDEEIENKETEKNNRLRLQQIQEQKERFSKYDEIGNPDYFENIPLENTIGRMKDSIREIERRHKGKPTKSYDAESF